MDNVESYINNGNLNDKEYSAFRKAVIMTLSMCMVMWTIKALEWGMNTSFGTIGGIYPRTLKGTIGIITSPLIHSNIYHLLSNTFPFVFLGTGLFFFYRRIALEVFLWIYVSTGIWVWVAARESYHVGASGVIYGLAAFIFFSGIFRRKTNLMALSLIVMFMYGGLIYGIFPGSYNGHISWESHLFGGISGLLTAYFFRKEPILRKLPTPTFRSSLPKEYNTTASSHFEITYHFKPKEK